MAATATRQCALKIKRQTTVLYLTTNRRLHSPTHGTDGLIQFDEDTQPAGCKKLALILDEKPKPPSDLISKKRKENHKYCNLSMQHTFQRYQV